MVDLTQLHVYDSLLRPAAQAGERPAEFVVVTDTHLVDPDTDHAGEFGSRLKQNDRIDVALRLIGSLDIRPVVHLGDLVQDYPDSDTHRGLIKRATEQVREMVGAEVHFAPGNTDVGDKSDPSSPAVLASDEILEGYAETTAPPWSSFPLTSPGEPGPELRGVILASSIFNSGSEMEAAQWAWLEQTFADAVPTVLFWHHPLFLRDVRDPGLGNYDAIAEPARGRLLRLIQDHPVLGVFTGHSHFWFRNVLGDAAQAYGINSTSFTRPGFCELFSSGPPPDRGRDDADKLGFVVVRAHTDDSGARRLRVHPVRSGSTTALRQRGITANPVLTGTPRDCAGAAIGVVARHPIAVLGEVPDVFPSVVRQPVRDDHALLACLELGGSAISVNAADLSDPTTAERLALLRREGMQVTARWVWAEGEPLPRTDDTDPVDRWELVLLDRSEPSAAELAALEQLAQPVTFSTLQRRPKGAAELSRWRYGFDETELARAAGASGADGWAGDHTLLANRGGLPSQGDALLAWLREHPGVELVRPAPGDGELGQLAVDLLAATAAGTRLWIDGLSELDRTLDLSPGLLDRQRNPQPGFHLLRVLTTLCHARPARVQVTDGEWTVTRDDLQARLITEPAGPLPAGADLIDLGSGMRIDSTVGDIDSTGGDGALPGPVLAVSPTGR